MRVRRPLNIITDSDRNKRIVTMNTSSPFVPPRRTKIVATIGPASRSPEMIEKLIAAGANVFRLNFSHGSADEHLQVLTAIRAASAKLEIPVGILQDLSGPKIRISNVSQDFVQIPDGATVSLKFAEQFEKPLSDAATIYVETVNPLEILQPGHQLLLADGIIELEARNIDSQGTQCFVRKGGRLRSRVGIAFPDSAIDLPAATAKDIRDLEWGIENGVDYAAISFVQNAKDILKLREKIKSKGGDVQLISKIERRAALQNIDEIVQASDGLMVARGDLGLELPLEQLPLVQKGLIEKANNRGIPVIVATQMLHSMITSIRPTRAEVTDIAFAVMSGADAVMLSEETAIGEHPIQAVEYLGKVSYEAEKSFVFEEYKLRLRDADRLTVSDAVAYAACAAAVKVNAAAIIACTSTGASARLLAKYRPQQALYGVSNSDETLNRLTLHWGVVPMKTPSTATHADELDAALATVKSRERLPSGSRAVITGGLSVGTPGSSSVLEIREL